MKRPLIIAAALSALICVMAGCGKKTDTTQIFDKFGTNKLETVFAAGGAPQKAAIRKAESFITAHNYGAAYDSLQRLSKDPTLNSDQAQAIKDSLLELGNVPRNAP